mmetsp:Transcript_8451/g.25056  ORF Transcript_8451/g.25056 Transcript_8451/m.25056 type:complete len:235 (+) Transcript_8451:414-1118(+)
MRPNGEPSSSGQPLHYDGRPSLELLQQLHCDSLDLVVLVEQQVRDVRQQHAVLDFTAANSQGLCPSPPIRPAGGLPSLGHFLHHDGRPSLERFQLLPCELLDLVVFVEQQARDERRQLAVLHLIAAPYQGPCQAQTSRSELEVGLQSPGEPLRRLDTAEVHQGIGRLPPTLDVAVLQGPDQRPHRPRAADASQDHGHLAQSPAAPTPVLPPERSLQLAKYDVLHCQGTDPVLVD